MAREAISSYEKSLQKKIINALEDACKSDKKDISCIKEALKDVHKAVKGALYSLQMNRNK